MLIEREKRTEKKNTKNTEINISNRPMKFNKDKTLVLRQNKHTV